MFESLPFNPFGENNEVNFESGENIRGIFTLSNDILDQDLEVSVVDGIKNARVGKDAFTYASPQIVTIDEIKGKFYSKRLYKAVLILLLILPLMTKWLIGLLKRVLVSGLCYLIRKQKI